MKHSAGEDARLVARVWKEKGPQAASRSFEMIVWLHDLVKWEAGVLASAIRILRESELDPAN